MSVVWLALRNWKLMIALAGALYVGWLHLQIAHKDAKLADCRADVEIMKAEVVQARESVAAAKAVNDGNADELAQIRKDHVAAVDALTRQLERAKAQKEKVKVVKQVIRETVEVCPPGPVPPGINAALDGLRLGIAPGPGRTDQDRARPAPGS